MQLLEIDYRDTGYFQPLIIDYLDNKPELKSLYNCRPDIENFEQLITERSKSPINREILVKVLKEQYKELDISGIVQSQIDALLSPNTFTVTTGHQLNIFTGPLYFIYKIITTIQLAEELNKKYPGKHIVPLYWMATEDHDFAEINHFNLYGKKISWDIKAKGATGEINPASLAVVLDEIKGILGSNSPASEKMVSLFSNAYLKNTTLADATRCFVHELFKEYGLIIIDANDARLKKQFAEIMLQDIIGQQSHRLVEETNTLLLTNNYQPQVHSRNINFFYLDKELRERIVKEDEKYKVLNTNIELTEEELKEQLKINPEYFSPNVITRGLYQEYILPNLAYIGGGGELSYWLQLKSTFDHYQIPFPCLMLRNSFLHIDAKSTEKLKSLSLQPQKLFMETEQLIQDFVKTNATNSISLLEEQKTLSQLFSSIKEKAQIIDPTLVPAAASEETKMSHAIKHFEEKLLKAEKQKFEVQINQIRKIKDKLFPNGGLQERNANFLEYYMVNPEFIHQIKTASDPFKKSMQILL